MSISRTKVRVEHGHKYILPYAERLQLGFLIPHTLNLDRHLDWLSSFLVIPRTTAGVEHGHKSVRLFAEQLQLDFLIPHTLECQFHGG